MLSALLAPPGSFSYLSFFSFSFRPFDLFDISSFISICTFPFSTLSSPSHFHFHFPLSSLIYLHHLTFLLRAFRPFCLSSFHLVILSSFIFLSPRRVIPSAFRRFAVHMFSLVFSPSSQLLSPSWSPSISDRVSATEHQTLQYELQQLLKQVTIASPNSPAPGADLPVKKVSWCDLARSTDLPVTDC